MSRWWPTAQLVRHTIDVDGVARTYWLDASRAPSPDVPLVLGLHGLGMTGRNLEAITGLAARSEGAGVIVVLPDAWEQIWDVAGTGPNGSDVDDGAFLRALVARLRDGGLANDAAPYVVGISNGALMAERTARERLLEVRGFALVAGSTRLTTRDRTPVPLQRTAALLIEGTADPAMPYRGGPIRSSSPLARLIARRVRRATDPPAHRVTVGVEAVVHDWSRANGVDGDGEVSALPRGRGLPVTVRRWTGPGGPAVVLYRVEGGGHTWPGGPRLLPAALVGRAAPDLDATGIVLAAASSLEGGAARSAR